MAPNKGTQGTVRTVCAGRTITDMDTAVIDAAGLQQLVAALQDLSLIHI